MAIFIILLSFYIFVLPFILLYYVFKFWKNKKKKISLFFMIMLIFLYAPLICDIGCDVCGLKKEVAQQKVISDLTRRKLDTTNLKYVGHVGSCTYTFLYQDSNHTIDYVILSTWLHGVKLTLNDHNKSVD